MKDLFCICRNTTRKTNQCVSTEENGYWSLKEIIFGVSTVLLIVIIIVIIIKAVARPGGSPLCVITVSSRTKRRKIYIYIYINVK